MSGRVRADKGGRAPIRRRSNRRRLGATLGLLSALALTAAPAASAQQPLLPDLQPLALERGATIGLYPEGGAMILDVGFKAANVGAGPLELEPLPEPPPSDPAYDCDGDGAPGNDRPEQQNVYLDADSSGSFDAGVDTAQQSRVDGCSVYHPGHMHWHAAVLTTDLIPDTGPDPVRGLDKLSFCLTDAGVFDSALPGFNPAKVYPLGGCATGPAQGVSVGWYDRYSVGLAGQQIDVTGLAAGNYCVRQAIDSSASIDELDESNNTVETRVALDPGAGELTVLAGGCAGGEPPVVDTTPPDTQLVNTPRQRLRTRRKNLIAQFGFTTAEPNPRLSCSLDGAAFKRCASPAEVKLRARRGRWTEHSFAVRAADQAGNTDRSPALWRGIVKRRR